MPIRVIDEITPNGRTFPIADINNIRGGNHYASTHDEMLAIHESRLVDGTQCYVQDEKQFYIYDGENKKWVQSNIGSELKYKCTVNSIADTAMSTATIGHLPQMKRQDLEKLSINDIFTRALFAEQLPYKTYSKPYYTTLKAEVGSKISSDKFIFNSGYLEIGYVLDDANTIVTLVYNYQEKKSDNLPYVKSTPINLGLNSGYISGIAKCYPSKVPDNITDMLRSSWGRSISDFKNDNPTATLPDFTDVILNEGNITGDVIGYYKLYYMPGSIGVQDTLYNDYRTNGSYITGQVAAYIKSLDDVSKSDLVIQVGDDIQGLPNTAFVYFLIPQGMQISQVFMKNGLTNQYDEIPEERFGKVDEQFKGMQAPISWSQRRVNGQILYNYNVWFVAKGDKNSLNAVSCSTAPLKIKVEVN